jgi:hypothetical protein
MNDAMSNVGEFQWVLMLSKVFESCRVCNVK